VWLNQVNKMRGALINLSANLTGLTFPVVPVAFNTEVYDTDGLFDPGIPGTFTIPAGIEWARLSCGIRLPDNGGAGSMFLGIYKNNEASIPNGVNTVRNSNSGYIENAGTCITPWIPVEEDDYFTVRVNRNGLGNPTAIVAGWQTFFHIEVR
jgi:hypothetical protein